MIEGIKRIYDWHFRGKSFDKIVVGEMIPRKVMIFMHAQDAYYNEVTHKLEMPEEDAYGTVQKFIDHGFTWSKRK